MQEKKRHRSPSFPYLDLEEAITKLGMIYEKDKRATTTADSMLEHMGYSTKGGKSGSAGRALSAMGQYGLVEDVSGNYRISDIGFQILHLPSEDPRKLVLLRQAASKPPLFQKILTYFAYDLPSDTTLRSHLILQEGFNPDSVGGFIRNLRKTKEFVMLDESDYNGSREDGDFIEGEIVRTEPMAIQEPRALAQQLQPVFAGVPNLEQADHLFSYQLSFPRNIRAEVRIFGKDLRKQDIERLRKEVGDLAGAFDDDASQDDQSLTEVSSTQ